MFVCDFHSQDKGKAAILIVTNNLAFYFKNTDIFSLGKKKEKMYFKRNGKQNTYIALMMKYSLFVAYMTALAIL